MSTEQIFEGPDTIEESNAPWDDSKGEDFHVKVFYDKYPCTPGHLLFVPKHNTMGILAQAFEDAVREGKRMINRGECDGFNVGLNYGEAAGQTVSWPHIHLIPRREGDVSDPVGGVRHTIPGKGNYRKGLGPAADSSLAKQRGEQAGLSDELLESIRR
jgi:diadenosine tetraphosphate (Ap4A) HIT family hydrolase